MEKFRHSCLLCFLAPLFLVACNELDTVGPGKDDTEVYRVSFEMPVLRSGDGDISTRMSLEPSGTGFELWWESSDTVGIFPNAGSQVYFCMAGASGGRVATFDGGGWSLRGQSQYFSYFPFVGKAGLESNSIPVSFMGQRQQGTSSFRGIPFYLASGGVSAQNGNLHFSYSLLNTVIRLTVTLPAGTYTKASLTVDDPLFVKEGHYDLSSPSIVGDHFTRTLEIALDNFVLPSPATVPIYMTSAPVDLRNKNVTVEILSDDGRRYRCVKTPTYNYVAGEQFGMACTMTSIDPQSVAEWVQTPLWSSTASIPEYRADQIAAWAEEAADPAFDASAHRMPYLQWYDQPASPNGTCAILITGEDFNQCPDSAPIDLWCRELTSRGVQCVSLVYRTPRNLDHFSRSAWQDAQRAVRVIRFKATNEPALGLDPNKIGIVGYSAGAYTGLLIATSSTANAYTLNANDLYDTMSPHINWAVLHSPVYTTSDANGMMPKQEGYGSGISLDAHFLFDVNTCPVCLLQGQDDPYSPLSSTMVYRRMRQTNAHRHPIYNTVVYEPAEVHLYPGKGHEVCGFDQALEFLTQMGFLGTNQPAEILLNRYGSDAARGEYVVERVWPSPEQTPNYTAIPVSGDYPSSLDPVIEWHFPAVKKSKAIQLIFSGGAYNGSMSITDEVAPARRYLNEKGITVVTLLYRYPRPVGLSKHTAAWQDLQRAIRVVRDHAPALDLDPNRIGVMGSSAGGHLAVMGVTSSRHPAYSRIDAIDDLPCNVQWGIGIFPAYLLTDDWEYYGVVYSDPLHTPDLLHCGNAYGGNQDAAVLAPEFSFDLDTAPMLLIHGDDDLYAAMNSVKLSEKLRSIGVPSELHTLANQFHDFQTSTIPGTGAYNYLDRIYEFLGPWLED